MNRHYFVPIPGITARMCVKIHEESIKERDRENIPFVFIKTVRYSGKWAATNKKHAVVFAWNLTAINKEYARIYGKPDEILASSVTLTLVAGIKIARRFGVPCICEVKTCGRKAW